MLGVFLEYTHQEAISIHSGINNNKWLRRIIIMKKLSIALTLVTTLGLSHTQASDEWAVGSSASTLGLGLEITKPLNNQFNFRFGVNKYADTLSRDINQINYEAEIHLQTVAFNTDWHPFTGGFTHGLRLTGGFMINNNEISGTATPGDNLKFSIGGKDYTDKLKNADVAVNSKIGFKKFAPYFGFGYDKVSKHHRGLSLMADFGLLFQGSPKVDTPTVSGSDSQLIEQVDLDNEVAKIENDLGDFKVWPVLAIGLNYQF